MGALKIFTFHQFIFRKLLQDVLQEKKGIHREEDLDLRHWKVAQTSTHRVYWSSENAAQGRQKIRLLASLMRCTHLLPHSSWFFGTRVSKHPSLFAQSQGASSMWVFGL